MSVKNDTEVIINGKIYTLSGYESEEYLQKVATYINGKYSEFKEQPSFKRQHTEEQRTLVALNIADDYFKAKKQADILENDIEAKDKQLYDLKHQSISIQIKLETIEKELNKVKEEIIEKDKKIIRLETELKDINSLNKLNS